MLTSIINQVLNLVHLFGSGKCTLVCRAKLAMTRKQDVLCCESMRFPYGITCLSDCRARSRVT